jgi:hypothetical protein
MKTLKISVAAAALALVVTAGSADAQVSFSLAGGPSFPTGDDHHLDMGYHAQIGAELGLPLMPFSVRLDGAFNRFTEDHGNYDVLSGSANAILRIPMVGLTPYLIGGLGVYSAEDEAHEGERETNLGVNLGVGARLGLPGLGVFAEARVHNPFGDHQLRYVPLSIGVRF